MIPVCQASRSCKRYDQLNDQHHQIGRTHSISGSTPLSNFPRNTSGRNSLSRLPTTGSMTECCTPRAALRETLTAEDNKRALVGRRARPIIPPAVCREARRCELDGVSSRVGTTPVRPESWESRCVRVHRVYNVRASHRPARRL